MRGQIVATMRLQVGVILLIKKEPKSTFESIDSKYIDFHIPIVPRKYHIYLNKGQRKSVWGEMGRENSQPTVMGKDYKIWGRAWSRSVFFSLSNPWKNFRVQFLTGFLAASILELLGKSNVYSKSLNWTKRQKLDGKWIRIFNFNWERIRKEDGILKDRMGK